MNKLYLVLIVNIVNYQTSKVYLMLLELSMVRKGKKGKVTVTFGTGILEVGTWPENKKHEHFSPL